MQIQREATGRSVWIRAGRERRAGRAWPVRRLDRDQADSIMMSKRIQKDPKPDGCIPVSGGGLGLPLQTPLLAFRAHPGGV